MSYRIDGVARRSVVGPMLFLFILGCAVFPSCSKHGDEEAISNLVDRGASLAEEHDIGGMLDLATEDFEARPGPLDRRTVKGVLWRIFQYYGPLHVLYPNPGIVVEKDGNRATAKLPFLIVKKEQAFPHLDQLRDDPMIWLQEIGEHADLYHLTLQLVKSSGHWMVAQAVVEQFTGLGFREYP